MRFAALMLALMPVLAPLPLAAQAWNEEGPTRDMLSNSTSQFDRLRAAANDPQQQVMTGTPFGGAPMQRAPIPMLDWTPPPAAAPAPAQRRRVVRRAAPRPAPQPVERSPAPMANTVQTTTVSTTELERNLAERQRLLDQMRQQLDDDRRRVQQLQSTNPR